MFKGFEEHKCIWKCWTLSWKKALLLGAFKSNQFPWLSPRAARCLLRSAPPLQGGAEVLSVGREVLHKTKLFLDKILTLVLRQMSWDGSWQYFLGALAAYLPQPCWFQRLWMRRSCSRCISYSIRLESSLKAEARIFQGSPYSACSFLQWKDI